MISKMQFFLQAVENWTVRPVASAGVERRSFVSR